MIFFYSSRRRHTRYIGDWSSDVCSSDLVSYNSGILPMNTISGEVGATISWGGDKGTEVSVYASGSASDDNGNKADVTVEVNGRSEERRVGKECRARMWPEDIVKKRQ